MTYTMMTLDLLRYSLLISASRPISKDQTRLCRSLPYSVTEQPGAKPIDEPPHWMMHWPFDSKTTAPPQDHTARTYIMLDGAPYGPLMIYQDPKEIVGH
jgi:hypothetical protein